VTWKAFYDNGEWELRDALGWAVEKTGQSCTHRPDMGEINSTGDLVETALILGQWGFAEYFEDAETRKMAIEGVSGTHRFAGAYLFVAQQPAGAPLTLRYDLTRRDIVLAHRTRDIRVCLRGDAVEAMDNFGADLTFFDPLAD